MKSLNHHSLSSQQNDLIASHIATLGKNSKITFLSIIAKSVVITKGTRSTITIVMLLLLNMFCSGFLSAEASKERVGWAGITFRGRHDKHELQFPICSRDNIHAQLQNEITRRLKEIQHTDCELIIGEQFDYSKGDWLVLSCVLESEDVTIAKNGESQFGQVTIAASLVVFNFNQAIIVSSVPLGVIYEIEPSETKGTFITEDDKVKYVKSALIGGEGMVTSLVDQFCKKYANTSIRPKGNFNRLQVQSVDFDVKTETALGITSDLLRQKWKTYFSHRIALGLGSSFGINILPVTDGDGTIPTMTICFTDKSRLSADMPLDKVLNVKLPTVIAKTTFNQAGDYVLEKYSNKSQVAKTFGCNAKIEFYESGIVKHQSSWSYGVNRVFAPQFAKEQTPEQRNLYHRASIENGLYNVFIKNSLKDKKWSKIADSLKK